MNLSFPEFESMYVALSACFSVSDAVIFRNITAADSSEEIVAAANESPVCNRQIELARRA